MVLEGVKREFADNTGLHATDLVINPGEFISIRGPSGCGKSTLLRCIAGLETPDSGTIAFAGKEVFGPHTNVPVNKRHLSMVFQDLALWPHMTVFANAAFPLEVRKHRKTWPEQHQREQRWFTPAEAAEAVTEPGLAAIIRATLKRDGRPKP